MCTVSAVCFMHFPLCPDRTAGFNRHPRDDFELEKVAHSKKVSAGDRLGEFYDWHCRGGGGEISVWVGYRV